MAAPIAITIWRSPNLADALAVLAVSLWPLALLGVLGSQFVLAVHPVPPRPGSVELPYLSWHAILAPMTEIGTASAIGAFGTAQTIVGWLIRRAGETITGYGGVRSRIRE